MMIVCLASLHDYMTMINNQMIQISQCVSTIVQRKTDWLGDVQSNIEYSWRQHTATQIMFIIKSTHYTVSGK